MGPAVAKEGIDHLGAAQGREWGCPSSLWDREEGSRDSDPPRLDEGYWKALGQISLFVVRRGNTKTGS